MATARSVAVASCRYRLNEPAVVADNFDGEVVIMNLELGNYFTLDRNGTGVWRLIADGFTSAEIGAAAAARYGLPSADICLDIARFVETLVEEQLIVPVGNSAADRNIAAADAFPLAVYAPPTMVVYSDMKDLIALDPPMPVLKRDTNA